MNYWGRSEKTIKKGGVERKECRYFISSLKENANTTLDKQAAENLNIIRKWCLSILKMLEIFRPNLFMKKKRFVVSMNPAEFLEQVLNFLKDNFQK